jgi:hypothetical protein
MKGILEFLDFKSVRDILNFKLQFFVIQNSIK